MSCLDSVKNIHMIGVGGAGMCALAQMLRQMGYKVGGSDCNESDNLSRLCEQGVPVHLGHDPALVQGADLVVYSAAIAADNPERLEADRLSIPQASRAELFGAISRLFKEVIAVSGTHGKTTTTGMITQLLASGEKAPSAIVGGYLPFLDGNGRLGARDLLVCEACEFADTFLHLSRDTAVLLNIDDDHLEYFGTSDRLVESFHRFAREAKRVVAYGEDARVLRAVAGVDGEVTTFGFNRENEHYTDRVECVGGCYSFDWMRRGKKLARICLSVAGRHNILNALAAAVVASVAAAVVAFAVVAAAVVESLPPPHPISPNAMQKETSTAKHFFILVLSLSFFAGGFFGCCRRFI